MKIGIEDEARRLETKRKGTYDGRKSRRKKMKFDRLEGWGEDNAVLEVVEVVEVGDSSPVDIKETVIEMELRSVLKEPSKTKKLISKGSEGKIPFQE